jgi:uncharacterized protein GlcG (DUF336 family)
MERAMNRILLAAATLLIGGPAIAQVITTPPTMEDFRNPRPPHGHGVSPELAVEAAQAALAACAAQGAKVTALMVDSEDVPVVLISADGGVLTERLAASKARIAVKTGMTSAAAAERAKTDAAFAAQIKADPYMAAAFSGGLPVTMDGKNAGAFAVGGGSVAGQDEACAKAGLAKIQDRLR